jgi:hypothetical protein
VLPPVTVRAQPASLCLPGAYRESFRHSKTPVKKQEFRNDYNVVPQEGFEPPTPSLRMMCSTD